MSTNALPCAVCGKTGSQYCLNLANTAAYCSRECHAKAAETRGYGYDYHRMSDPEYKAFAASSAAAASRERVDEFLANHRFRGSEPSRQPEHPTSDKDGNDLPG